MDRTARDALLLRRAPFAVVELDTSLRLTAWNDTAADLFGLQPSDVGAAVGDRLPAVDPAFWSLLAASAGPRTAVMVGDPARTIEWTPAQDEHGLACYAHDLTARIPREQTHKLEGRLLRAILDNLDIIAWTMEEDGLCTFHQGKGLAAIGLPPDAFVGRNIRDLYRGDLDPAPLDRVFTGELQYVQTLVQGQHFENWMIPVRGDTGRVELLVALSLNVSDLRRGELELRDKLTQIEAQQRTIRELSTPIVEVWDRVLTLPILGMLDAARATEIMENLLHAITTARARFAIIDLTGVHEIDAATASYLLGLVRAIRLLGAEGIVTGVHPNIAQTIVDLDVDIHDLVVRGSLREALVHCIGKLSARAG